MKLTTSTLLSLATAALAAPNPTHTTPLKPRQASHGCPSAVTLDAKTNVFRQYTLHANNFYRSEVEAAAAQISDPTLAAKALKVADVGSFLWIDTIANIKRFEDNLVDVPCDHIFGAVVYNLPGRDCAAKASNGELRTGEINRYKYDYIDKIAEIIKKHSNVAFALVIEPDSLPNLVTNSDVQKCRDAAREYREGVAYALRTLNLPNVVMYIDAGHGGWLGWDSNLRPGAEELASVYRSAGSPSQVRGIATNVAGWNAWDLTPGEFSRASDAQWNQCQNEKTYVEVFGRYLRDAGMPNHAIVDTGRNGVQGLRKEWGNWCNINGAGFGQRFTTNTGSELCDAFVWVKPGGESDGTSDPSAERYDSFCGKEESFKPSPEAGQWNQAYFEMLLRNANPPF